MPYGKAQEVPSTLTWPERSGTSVQVQGLVEPGIVRVHVGSQVEGGAIKGDEQVGVNAAPGNRVPLSVIELGLSRDLAWVQNQDM